VHSKLKVLTGRRQGKDRKEWFSNSLVHRKLLTAMMQGKDRNNITAETPTGVTGNRPTQFDNGRAERKASA